MLNLVNTSKTNKGVQIFERMTYCKLIFAKKCIQTQSISLKLFAADIYNDLISIIITAEQCIYIILLFYFILLLLLLFFVFLFQFFLLFLSFSLSLFIDHDLSNSTGLSSIQISKYIIDNV